MGQYYKVVNLDKKEFIHPHKMGDGLKLLEFGCSSNGTMTALAVLLANSNGRGGGDLQSNNAIIGRWAGDRIVVAGDYDKEGDAAFGAYGKCCEGDGGAPPEFKDISYAVRLAITDDKWILEEQAKAPASFEGVLQRDAKAGDVDAVKLVERLKTAKVLESAT